MTKLVREADVEILPAVGHLKLTSSGLAKLGAAATVAPALWASLK